MPEIYATKLLSKFVFVKNRFDFLFQYIAPEKKEKLKRFKRWEDFQRGLISDVLIRSIICRKLNIRNFDIEFRLNKHGKPYLKDNNFYFNISHSGEWVICVIDKRNIVGIDIEEVKKVDLNIIHQVFHPNEVDMFNNFDTSVEKKDLFFDIWTIKESYIKANGRGLSIYPNTMEVRFNRENNIRLLLENIDTNRFFKQYKMIDGYKIAVCNYSSNSFPEKVILRDLDEIIADIK
ncbi:MAG: 4'-phosphopantetheinyl transferase superfamily protein [Bacteroidetes bacterium]|nr:4'-phosphopantetheinyl transferase superfamily protein [Bacteroidota bacterium]